MSALNAKVVFQCSVPRSSCLIAKHHSHTQQQALEDHYDT